MLREVTGNIFTSECQTLVNTVNCVGVMGAGVALEFKLRYPAMFDRYVVLCRERRLSIGKLWLYRPSTAEGPHWVLNFPTKKHWRYPSREQYLHAGLRNFVDTYRRRRIESVAFPTLGASNGGIPEETSVGIMREYLGGVDIDVEVFRFDPAAEDDLCRNLRRSVERWTDDEFASRAGLTASRVAVVRRALDDPEVRNVRQLASRRGIGEKTLAAVCGVISALGVSDTRATRELSSGTTPGPTAVGSRPVAPGASRTLFD